MWYNAVIAALLRSPLHALLSGQIMLITVTGRKSGATFTAPVNYIQDEDVLWVVSARDRTWWRNARGGCAVSLRLRGRDVPATAVAVESDAAVAKALGRICELRPGYARILGVTFSGDGVADAASLQRAAQARVVVRTVAQQ